MAMKKIFDYENIFKRAVIIFKLNEESPTRAVLIDFKVFKNLKC
jgi:hypothetical protein